MDAETQWGWDVYFGRKEGEKRPDGSIVEAPPSVVKDREKAARDLARRVERDHKKAWAYDYVIERFAFYDAQRGGYRFHDGMGGTIDAGEMALEIGSEFNWSGKVATWYAKLGRLLNDAGIRARAKTKRAGYAIGNGKGTSNVPASIEGID